MELYLYFSVFMAWFLIKQWIRLHVVVKNAWSCILTPQYAIMA
jgi:hypothetical protein